MLETTRPSQSPPAHRILAEGRFRTQTDPHLWTAARCNRLIRQLQCRLGALRKPIQETRQPETSNISKRASSHHGCPSRPAKRIRHTYAQRRSTSSKSKAPTTSFMTPQRSTRTFSTMKLGKCSPVSGRIDFSTPMLRKICFQPDTPSCLPKKKKSKPGSTSPSLVTNLHILRRLAPEGHYRIYESIFSWLSSLLRSIETRKPAPRPKSLLSMCLRKVPAALANIEAWDRQVAETDGTRSVWQSTKAAIELYGQLEMFGSPGLGWDPLGFVVRAHALSILQKAVSEGLFEPEFVRLIADLYLSFKCYQDAAVIVVSLPFPLPGPQSSLSTLHEVYKMQPLVAIVESLQGEGNSRVAFGCLSALVENKILPLTWLYTKAFRTIWTTALEAISTDKPEPAAVNFMCMAMGRLLLHTEIEESSQQNARKQALANLVAGLAAIAVGVDRVSSSSASTYTTRRLTYLLDQLVTSLQGESNATGDDDLLVLVTARYIIMARNGHSHIDSAVRRHAENECKRLLVGDHGSSSQAQYRTALFLVCSIAQYRGRACSIACHTVLSEICTMLDNLGLPNWFRDGLMVDGAFLLAQNTKDIRDLAFAEKMPTAAGGFSGMSTLFSGWRWEEGISEWVQPSPKSKVQGANNGDRERSSDSSDQALGGQESVRGCAWTQGRLREQSSDPGITSSVSGNLLHGSRDGQSDCQEEDDSADELSSEWEDLIGICGRGVGSVSRTNTTQSSGNDPGRRNSGGIMSRREEAKQNWGKRNSGESRISNNGAIKRVKRAGTRTRAGRSRGMSQCGADDAQGRDDDWDELM